MRAPIPPDGEDRYRYLLEQAQEVLSLRTDPRPWIEENLFLRSKDQRVVPFHFRPVQAHFWAQRTGWDMILKARQMGFTSLICALFFADTVLRPNTVSVMVAHDADSSEKIFGIVNLFWERLPEEEKRRIGEPKYFTKREFYWPKLNSRFYVGTAGSLAFGRGQTINNFHGSELGYWPRPELALTALAEAVPLSGRIVIESTANGMGNFFHDLWIEARQGESRYRPHFYPWWWDPGYRLPGELIGELTEEEKQLTAAHVLKDDQIRWRREKRRQLRDRFPQEYPEDDVTCFLASGRCCFDTRALAAAQKRIACEPEPRQVSQLPSKGRALVAITPARLLVWREPEEGRQYVVGADIGEGLAHGDASAAVVLDRETGEQVAEVHGRVPVERFAHMLDALGRYYNKARLAVERNNHGHSALNTLRHTCQYPILYHHKAYDQSGSESQVLGYPTDQKTKPIMVDDFAAAIAEGHMIIHSSDLLDECFTFVTTDTGAQQAQPGKHDDRVIAAAIAWQVRKNWRPIVLIARGDMCITI